MVIKTIGKMLYALTGRDQQPVPQPLSQVEVIHPAHHAPSLGQIDSDQYPTVVVVPDVHGDYLGAVMSVWNAYARLEQKERMVGAVVEPEPFMDRFDEYLKNPDLKPEKPISTLKNVALVQLGDMVDRGPDSEKCVRFFQAIPAVLGWPMWGLFGNHEIMSMSVPTGDSEYGNPYVNRLDWGGYSSKVARDRAYGLFSGALFGGKCNRYRLFGKNSKDCTMFNILTDNLHGVIRWGSSSESSPGDAATLFVHGGVVLKWFGEVLKYEKKSSNGMDVNSINEQLRRIVKSLHKKLSVFLAISETSGFMDRSMQSLPTQTLCSVLMPKLLRAFNVSRIIVGHTPQDNDKVNTRCGGQLVLADAAISRWIRTTKNNLEKPSEILHPVAVILESTKAGELESMNAVYGDQDVESLFTREFYFATTNRSSDDSPRNTVVGPFMHIRRRDAPPRVLREYVVGNTVGVGAHVDPVIPIDLSSIASVSSASVSVVPDPASPDRSIVFVHRKCNVLLSMELAHVLSGSRQLKDYLTGMIDFVWHFILDTHEKELMLGLSENALLDSFCLDQNGSVFLADYVGVKPGNSTERKAELKQLGQELGLALGEIERSRMNRR